MEQFCKGVHRSIVTPVLPVSTRDKAKLLSQTDIVRYLYDSREKSASLQAVFKAPLSGKMFPKVDVVCFALRTNLLGVIKSMLRQRVASVAIVDETTEMIISSFSMSDLRGITSPEMLRLSGVSILEFLQQKGMTSVQPLTCDLSQSLESCVELMLRYRYHRLWFEDDGGKPSGVFTLSDVIRIVYDHERFGV